MKLERQQLAGVRKVEGCRHDHVREVGRRRGRRMVARQQRFARLDEHRQDDELIPGDGRRDHRIARQGEHFAHANRRHGGDEPWQHPEPDQQRDRDVGHEVDLEAPELLEVQRAGLDRRDGEEAERRETDGQPRRARDRLSRDAQYVQQHLLALHADERHAQDDGKEHHGRDDAVRERVERVRRDVERHEVERRPALDERGAEERGGLYLRKGQRDEEGEHQRQAPQGHHHRAGAQPQRAGLRVTERAEARHD